MGDRTSDRARPKGRPTKKLVDRLHEAPAGLDAAAVLDWVNRLEDLRLLDEPARRTFRVMVHGLTASKHHGLDEDDQAEIWRFWAEDRLDTDEGCDEIILWLEERGVVRSYDEYVFTVARVTGREISVP